MSKRYWKLLIEDILECIDKITNYVEDMSCEDFEKDSKTVDAVVRNLEIIGEASNHIPEEIKEKHESIDWRGIIGLRNRVAHVYFGIDLLTIWDIIQNEVPKLRNQMVQILEESSYET